MPIMHSWLPSIRSSAWPPGCRCQHFSSPEEAAILARQIGEEKPTRLNVTRGHIPWSLQVFAKRLLVCGCNWERLVVQGDGRKLICDVFLEPVGLQKSSKKRQRREGSGQVGSGQVMDCSGSAPAISSVLRSLIY